MLSKSGLWSFSVINGCLHDVISILSSRLSVVAIFLSLLVITSGTVELVFLYDLVTDFLKLF